MSLAPRVRARLAGALLVLTASVGLGWWTLGGVRALDPTALRDALAGWGAVAPLVYVAAFVVRPLALFPSVLMFVAGGLAFGAALGTLYAAIGGTLGALATFGVARSLGRDWAQRRLGARLRRLEDERWSAGLVGALNLLPVVPITAVNAAAGLSPLGAGTFAVAVAVGLTPRAFAYAYFGSRLLEARPVELALGALLVLGLVPVALFARRRLGVAAVSSAGADPTPAPTRVA